MTCRRLPRLKEMQYLSIFHTSVVVLELSTYQWFVENFVGKEWDDSLILQETAGKFSSFFVCTLTQFLEGSRFFLWSLYKVDPGLAKKFRIAYRQALMDLNQLNETELVYVDLASLTFAFAKPRSELVSDPKCGWLFTMSTSADKAAEHIRFGQLGDHHLSYQLE